MKSDVTLKSADLRGKIVDQRRDAAEADLLHSIINLNKGFPFVRKFAAYCLQIWRKLDRPPQRRLQGSLLALRL
jgi:hypothetical protein